MPWVMYRHSPSTERMTSRPLTWDSVMGKSISGIFSVKNTFAPEMSMSSLAGLVSTLSAMPSSVTAAAASSPFRMDRSALALLFAIKRSPLIAFLQAYEGAAPRIQRQVVQ